MSWPMHDAGSTTPDPGPEEARRQEVRREPRPEEPQPWQEEPQPWQEEPWPEEPEPGPDDADSPRRGRHAAAPDPLPPIEGLTPGGGPSPAETTLPLALEWPAPPARPTRPRRSPVPGPTGSPGAPPGWRRVPRTTDYPPACPPRRVIRSPATPQGRREHRGRPAAGPAAGPARAPARRAPRGRARPSAPAWCGPAPAWRSAPWSRGPPASCAPSSWSTHWAPSRSATRTTTPTRCRTPSTT